MKKWAIVAGILGLALIAVVGWMMLRGKDTEVGGQKKTNKTLTVLPTAKPSPVIPTATPEITRTGNMFVTITTPEKGAIVKTPSVTVKGTTLPNADVGINDKDVIADAKGNFSAIVAVDLGENEIAVVATNDQGNLAEQTVVITRE